MPHSTLASRNHRRQSKQSHATGSNGYSSETDVLRSIRQLGTEVTQSVKARAKDLGETANEYLKKGRKRADALEQAIQRRVVKRPLAAVLAAAGLGVLIGMFCRRRK